MLEKDFQILFNKWCKHVGQGTAAYELKLARTDSLSFDVVVEHQVNALYNAKHGKVVFKIPDCGYQNPFDSFVLEGVPAYVVVMYMKHKKEFMIIDIDMWIHEKIASKRKSLTYERAKELGRVINIP